MAKQKSTKASKKIGKTTKMETTTKSKGLGDTIEKITEATGIKAVVKAIAGEDCGCDERRDKLNKIFPYSKQPECLSPEEVQYLSSGVLRKRTLNLQDREQIATIHARVFNHKFDIPCTCSPKIWMQWMRELQDLLDVSE
jgi:predicted Zn-ribbon and HTH transcriptional regulator